MLFYLEERDNDFFNVCEKIHKEYRGSYISVRELTEKAIYHPAESFYILPGEIMKLTKLISKGQKLTSAYQSRQELYTYIENRYREISQEDPTLKSHQIARIIYSERAPRFYISPKRALTIYYSMIKSK